MTRNEAAEYAAKFYSYLEANGVRLQYTIAEHDRTKLSGSTDQWYMIFPPIGYSEHEQQMAGQFREVSINLMFGDNPDGNAGQIQAEVQNLLKTERMPETLRLQWWQHVGWPSGAGPNSEPFRPRSEMGRGNSSQRMTATEEPGADDAGNEAVADAPTKRGRRG